MSDPITRQQKPIRPQVPLRELELLVRPPGNPYAIQAFTAAERIDAELFAAEVGAEVEVLH